MEQPLDKKAVSRDGYIIDQARVTNVPYGCRTSDSNGCGWIAAYNFLKIMGRDDSVFAVAQALCRHSLFRGRLGTSPFRLRRYVRRLGFPIHTALGKKRTVLAARQAYAGILLYRHSLGFHFVAFSRAEDGKVRFFNALPGRENHVEAMDSFLETHNISPLVCAVTVDSPGSSPAAAPL